MYRSGILNWGRAEVLNLVFLHETALARTTEKLGSHLITLWPTYVVELRV